MPHDDSLITTLVAAFVLAFVFGMIALRLKLSPLVGYLLAGVAVGPFTPGFVADTELAPQLAEVGVILLMFGVGLHFSPRELLQVNRIALPGALAQIGCATALGWALGRLVGLAHLEAFLLGFALSVASTVVLIRALEERRELKSDAGRIAVGWLIVEDLVIVVALVLLPLVITSTDVSPSVLAFRIGGTVVGVAVFLAVMFLFGRVVLPWLLVRIAHARSRELFTLGVLAIALGVAWLAYEVFGASFALGAFVAGLVLNGSPLGHKAAEGSLPLRDAFAVLFFVSVGMLFDPAIVLREPVAVSGILAIVLVGKSLAALVITSLFRLDRRTGLVVAASLAQVGEFSFLLAGLGMALGALTRETHDLVLSASLLSITLNPLTFALADQLSRQAEKRQAA